MTGSAMRHGSPPTDQRLAPRPYGAECDIGAFEYGAVAPPVKLDPVDPVGGVTELLVTRGKDPESEALAASALAVAAAFALWYHRRRRVH